MRRMTMVLAVLAALVLGIGSAGALTAESGHSATLLFDSADVASLAEWSDLNVAGLAGRINGRGVGSHVLAVDSSDRVYAMVRGYDDYNDWTWYDGIVRIESDGTGLESIDRFAWSWGENGQVKQDGDIRALRVARVRVPSTGALEERLVTACSGVDAAGDCYVEVFAYEIEAGTDGAYDAESLFTLDSADALYALYMAIDSTDGTVYLLQGGTGIDADRNGSVRAYDWSTSGYAERSQAVTSALVGRSELEFHAGSLFTIDRSNSYGTDRDRALLEIDPSGSDAFSVHAYMRQSPGDVNNGYFGMASNGTSLYLGEWVPKKRSTEGQVTLVVEGETTSSSDKIATFGTDVLWDLAGLSDGSLALGVAGEVYLLVASGGDSGGDTGGGGKGGGKGKTK